nr:MAG TPA: hypothetical protein [Caudoviricetes sp.]DAZ27644.1 MAG TPA: hypothetical protein [Caudoviricetes sp.]
MRRGGKGEKKNTRSPFAGVFLPDLLPECAAQTVHRQSLADGQAVILAARKCQSDEKRTSVSVTHRSLWQFWGSLTLSHCAGTSVWNGQSQKVGQKVHLLKFAARAKGSITNSPATVNEN